MAILEGVNCYLIVVLIYVFSWLMILSIFACLFWPSIYLPLWSIFSCLLPILKSELYFFCWIAQVLYIFYKTYIFKYFLPVYGLLFIFLTVFFDEQNFHFDEVQFTFLWLRLFVLCLRNFCQFWGSKIFCFLQEAL